MLVLGFKLVYIILRAHVSLCFVEDSVGGDRRRERDGSSKCAEWPSKGTKIEMWVPDKSL